MPRSRGSLPTAERSIVDRVLEHAAVHPDRVLLTQPVGGDEVVEYTWGHVLDQAQRMAAHLQDRGLPRGARVAILSKNCAHFIMAELAIWLGGYTTVAIFYNEAPETVRYVLDHSEASLLFVGKLDHWPELRAAVPASLPSIAFPLAPTSEFPTWDEIVATAAPLRRRTQIAADDIAMLLYTSGTTGRPKGAMLSFGALTRAAEGIAQELAAYIGDDIEPRVLSYLPLAHCLERCWVEGASLVRGDVQIFFTESLKTFLADLRRARPTLFVSVPRLWIKFQKGVFEQIPPHKLERLLRIPIVGRLVARKVRRSLGLDHVVLAGSGSAPIPPEVIRWYHEIGIDFVEAYGMTEDAAYSHMSRGRFAEPGWVGVPLPGVEVKLGDGNEILIKSPGQFSGYYKEPELTAAAFTEDGFFRTGDIGERRPDGMLRIVGRTKELFKTSKGKYVAPAPIENVLNAHPAIELSLVGGAGYAEPYALVMLAEELRPRLDDPAVRSELAAELEHLRQNVNATLAAHEKLAMIVVAHEPWTIENGMLTPTLKVKRNRVEAAVASRLDAWYAAGHRVHWAADDAQPARATERVR